MLCGSADEKTAASGSQRAGSWMSPLCLQAVTLGRKGEVLSHVAYAPLATSFAYSHLYFGCLETTGSPGRRMHILHRRPDHLPGPSAMTQSGWASACAQAFNSQVPHLIVTDLWITDLWGQLLLSRGSMPH